MEGLKKLAVILAVLVVAAIVSGIFIGGSFSQPRPTMKGAYAIYDARIEAGEQTVSGQMKWEIIDVSSETVKFHVYIDVGSLYENEEFEIGGQVIVWKRDKATLSPEEYYRYYHSDIGPYAYDVFDAFYHNAYYFKSTWSVHVNGTATITTPFGEFNCKRVLITEFREGRVIQTIEEWHESKTGLLIKAIYKSSRGQEFVVMLVETNIPELGGS